MPLVHSTAKKLLMRVQVDPKTHEAVGETELIVAGRMFDDFCIDEDTEALYLTTHRQNTIARVSMDPTANGGFTESVAGDPYAEELVGPAAVSGARRRPIWPCGLFPLGWWHRVRTARRSRPARQGFARGILAMCCTCLTARTLRAAESAPLRSSH
jgi:hypothetical protein